MEITKIIHDLKKSMNVLEETIEKNKSENLVVETDRNSGTKSLENIDINRNIFGIYGLVNLVTKRIYIGKGFIYSRLSSCRSELRHGNHRSEIMLKDYNRYGEESFEYFTLYEIQRELLNTKHEKEVEMLERKLVDMMHLTDNRFGYNKNLCPKDGFKLPDYVFRLVPINEISQKHN